MANQSQNLTVTNLGTATLKIVSTDTYNIIVTNQLPFVGATATQGAGAGAGTGSVGTARAASQVVTLIKQNGSTKYTSAAGDKGAILNGLSCTAGDTITVVTSSSQASDQQPNAVQTTISLSEGPL